ncbi:MAG: hypothetical protein ACXQT4_05515 [Methanotrichaceae archaeon]
MGLIADFRRHSLLYQTLITGVMFMVAYTLYMDYTGNASISDSLLATFVFASSYFVTSTLVLRRKLRIRK